MPSDRSDAALRERLEIAGKAAEGPWKSDVIPPEMVGARPRYVIRDGKRIVIVEDVHHFASWQKTCQHIAANSPDVVREDIEEILRLRKEVALLNKEADWLGLRLWGTGGVPPVEDFDVRADRIKMWREAARKAVEESA